MDLSGFKYTCPRCGGEYHCGCESCRKYNEGDGLTRSVMNGNDISCGYCGHTMSGDAWLDSEGEQIEAYEATQGGEESE